MGELNTQGLDWLWKAGQAMFDPKTRATIAAQKDAELTGAQNQSTEATALQNLLRDNPGMAKEILARYGTQAQTGETQERAGLYGAQSGLVGQQAATVGSERARTQESDESFRKEGEAGATRIGPDGKPVQTKFKGNALFTGPASQADRASEAGMQAAETGRAGIMGTSSVMSDLDAAKDWLPPGEHARLKMLAAHGDLAQVGPQLAALQKDHEQRVGFEAHRQAAATQLEKNPGAAQQAMQAYEKKYGIPYAEAERMYGQPGQQAMTSIVPVYASASKKGNVLPKGVDPLPEGSGVQDNVPSLFAPPPMNPASQTYDRSKPRMGPEYQQFLQRQLQQQQQPQAPTMQKTPAADVPVPTRGGQKTSDLGDLLKAVTPTGGQQSVPLQQGPTLAQLMAQLQQQAAGNDAEQSSRMRSVLRMAGLPV